jgi:hypothetical protein
MIAHELPETPSMHVTIDVTSEVMGGRGGGGGRPSVSYIECRLCGYEPEDQVSMPRHRCPKCHNWTWWRLVRPGTYVEHELPAVGVSHRPEGAEHHA